ncbi:MAG: hypothetical protein AB7T38_18620 [Nitrospirales bacterium]
MSIDIFYFVQLIVVVFLGLLFVLHGGNIFLKIQRGEYFSIDFKILLGLAIILLLAGSANVWMKRIGEIPTPIGPIVFKQIIKSHQNSIAKLKADQIVNPNFAFESFLYVPITLKKDIFFSLFMGKEEEKERLCHLLVIYGIPNIELLEALDLPKNLSEAPLDPKIKDYCSLPEKLDEIGFINRGNVKRDLIDFYKTGSPWQKRKSMRDLRDSLIGLNEENEGKLSLAAPYFSLLALCNFILADQGSLREKERFENQSDGFRWLDEGLAQFPLDLNLLNLKVLALIGFHANFHDAVGIFMQALHSARTSKELILNSQHMLDPEILKSLIDRFSNAELNFLNGAVYFAALDGNLDHLPGTDPLRYAKQVLDLGIRLDQEREYIYEDTVGLAQAIFSIREECPEREKRLEGAISLLGHSLDEARKVPDLLSVQEISRNLDFAIKLRCGGSQ